MSGIRFPVGACIFSSPQNQDQLWGPYSLLSDGYQGLFSIPSFFFYHAFISLSPISHLYSYILFLPFPSFSPYVSCLRPTNIFFVSSFFHSLERVIILSCVYCRSR